MARAFSDATSKDFNADQAKQMFKRLKDQKKKEHDSQVLAREFKKSCSATGGGRGLMPPPQPDGDDYEEPDLNEFDPVDTAYNMMVRPSDRIQSLSSAVTTPRRNLEVLSTDRMPFRIAGLCHQQSHHAHPGPHQLRRSLSRLPRHQLHQTQV